MEENSTGVNFTDFGASTPNSSNLIQTTYICVHSINVLLGVPTHSYVLRTIITGTRSGVAAEFFNLNLSICEIIICLISFFFLTIYWTRSLGIIRIAQFLIGIWILGRSLFQCLMCVERYLAVVHPVTFLKYKPLRYRLFCCSVVWIIVLLSCLCGLLSMDNFYMFVCLYSVEQLLFTFVQVFCLGAVLRALKQSVPGERRREREMDNPMKRRAFFLILVTTVCTVITNILFSVSGFSFILEHYFLHEMVCFGIISTVLAGFVQPFFHLHHIGKLSC